MNKSLFIIFVLVLFAVGCSPVSPATASNLVSPKIILPSETSSVMPATSTKTSPTPTSTEVPPTPTVIEVPLTATAEQPKLVLLELATVFPKDGQYKELPKITKDDITTGLWQKAVDELNHDYVPSPAEVVTFEWDTTTQAIGPAKSVLHPIGPNEKDRELIADSLSADEITLRLPIQPELGYAWIENYHGRGDVIVFPVKIYNLDMTSISIPVAVDVKTWLTDIEGVKNWGFVDAMFFRNKDNSATMTNVLGYLETGIDFTNSKVVGLDDLNKWKEVVEVTKKTKIISSKAGLVAWPLFCYRWK